MTSEIIKNTFQNVYRDDYKDSDNYYRILFNPGRAVQARELTQAQTILQKQIERFGRNIFKEGAAVNPIANIFLDTRYAFVKLQSATTLSEDLIGNTFTGSTSGVIAKVIGVVSAVDSDPATLYVAYISGGGTGNTNVRFSAGETITDGSNTYTVQVTNTTANPATGNGCLASVGSGEFFVLGNFVFTEAKSVLVSKYTRDPTGNIGFIIREQIVTENDDQALYDNQGDLPNTTAPGAHRYRITLSLVNESDVDSDQTFVYVARIEKGRVVDVNDGRGDYNKVRDWIAQRTFEESGNYTVKPPFVSFTENPDSDATLLLRTTKSISYVQGYRVDLLPATSEVDKPTTTKTINNEAIAVSYGNYIEVDNLKGIPNINEFEKWNLVDDSDYSSGSTLGTARIRAIEQTGSTYRFHLFDVQMSGVNNFRDTRSIGLSATQNARIVTDRGNAVIVEPTNNNVFFSLPNWRPSSIGDISLTVQRVFTATTDGSGEATINLATADEDFSSLSDWVVSVDSSGEIITPTLTATTTTQTTITGAPPSTSLTLFGFVQKGGASGSFRNKTLTTSTVTNPVESDGSGLLFVDLENVDIYELDSARLGSSSGANIKSRFRLDNGQRDNFYDHGRLILNSGETKPAGNVYVKFKHFAHSGTGNFFCVNSYNGQVDYDKIPTHRTNAGRTVFLSDVLDFRSTINDAGTGYTGAGAEVNELPQNTELVTADVTYYLPRKDKLVIDPELGLLYIKGTPGFNAKYPETPPGSMLVYKFSLNPNTLNEKDLSAEFINNRRYTMRDIGKLDEKIENVREIATLSLLDIQASTLEVLDADGLSRTKSGFLTDDFRDHRASDIDNEEYRASIDPLSYTMTTSYRQKNVGLIFDSDQSSNAVLNANLITLAYTEEVWLQQPEASRQQNVNPFTRIDYNGSIQLSPSEDEWVDEITITNVVQSTAARPVIPTTIVMGGGVDWGSTGGPRDDTVETRSSTSPGDNWTNVGGDNWARNN
jgi:hypothetical protein